MTHTFDYGKTYYKVTNKEECHHGFQYKDGPNILKEKFALALEGDCVPGGLYFTDRANVTEFSDYGCYVREITVPEDAQVVHVDNKWRADKLDLGKRWSFMDFMRTLSDAEINWEMVSVHQDLSEDFIRKFSNKVCWRLISYQQTLSEDFIREFSKDVDWSGISYRQELSEDFIRECSNDIGCYGWSNISSNQTLSEELIRDFSKRVIWTNISRHQKLSEELIRDFPNDVDWFHVSRNHKLSEEFMREFSHKVDWRGVRHKQTLSEDFIREFFKGNALAQLLKGVKTAQIKP